MKGNLFLQHIGKAQLALSACEAELYVGWVLETSQRPVAGIVGRMIYVINTMFR